MKSNFIFISFITFFLAYFAFSQAEPLVEYRCWQFQSLDPVYVTESLKKAPDYNINTVIYSHRMIADLPELFNEPRRARILTMLADEAHSYDLKVWLWLHELAGVPDEYMKDNRVQMDKKGFWKWLKKRYQRLVDEYPMFDGVMLTFHETENMIFRDSDVETRLSKPERFTRLINTIDDVLKAKNKDFVVRAFFYNPIELEWFSEGLKKVHPRVMLQAKCMPHDFSPHYPHNPIIGQFPDRKLIIEFSPSEGFYGASTLLFAAPSYFEWRWRYDLTKPETVGYNARLDQSVDALNNPQEIDLYSLYRFSEDAGITAEDVWDEWTRLRYNEKAAPFVEEALKVTRDIAEKTIYFKKFWIIRHSGLPIYKYAMGHITERSMAKWAPDNQEYIETEKRLLHPDPEYLEELLREKDESMALVHQSLGYLEKAKPYLKAEDYSHLVRWLNITARDIYLIKTWSEAFFGFRVMVEGYDVPGLSQRVDRALDALLLEARSSEVDPSPQDTQVIRRAVETLQVYRSLPLLVYRTFEKELYRLVGTFYRFSHFNYEKIYKNGETVYTVTWKSGKPQKQYKLRIAEDGRLLEL